MVIDETALYEETLREHGIDVAEDAYFRLSDRLVDKYGIRQAWVVAVNRALESERFYAHETGAERRRRRV